MATVNDENVFPFHRIENFLIIVNANNNALGAYLMAIHAHTGVFRRKVNAKSVHDI